MNHPLNCGKMPMPQTNNNDRIFLRCFFILMLMLSLFQLVGCSSLPKAEDITEEKAQRAADYIKERSGLIENGVSKIIELAITAIPQGSDKQHYINIVNGVSSKLNDLLVNGKFDSASIRTACKIEDPIIGGGIALAGELLIVELNTLRKNGYVDFTAAILTAATKGIADGTAQ